MVHRVVLLSEQKSVNQEWVAHYCRYGEPGGPKQIWWVHTEGPRRTEQVRSGHLCSAQCAVAGLGRTACAPCSCCWWKCTTQQSAVKSHSTDASSRWNNTASQKSAENRVSLKNIHCECQTDKSLIVKIGSNPVLNVVFGEEPWMISGKQKSTRTVSQLS